LSVWANFLSQEFVHHELAALFLKNLGPNLIQMTHYYVEADEKRFQMHEKG
jgi:hypothetical protein